MKQLKLPIEWIHCRHFNDCDAPLCPEDVNLKQCLWFPSEPVCRLRDAPEWVGKQRIIARLKGIDREKYFTLRMLQRITEIDSQLEGADPELFQGEKAWLARRTRNRKSEKPRTGRPDLEKRPQEPGNYMLF